MSERPPSIPPTLRQLGQAASEGDRAAFESLHARLTPGLRVILLRRTGNRADLADDLVQKTWMAVWDALERGTYNPEKAALSTFVYAVAHHQWVSSVRKLAAAGPASAPADPEAFAEDSTETRAALAEVLEDLRACLRGDPPGAGVLDAGERVLAGLVASGLGDRPLAQRLGVSPSTANARKNAMLEKLLRFLTARGHNPQHVRPLLEPAPPAPPERSGSGSE